VSDADPAARALRSVRGARGASSRRGMPGPASSRGSEGTSATSSSASASATTGGPGASVSTSSVVSFTSPYAPSLPASAARAAELAHSVRASARVPAGRVLHMPSPMALASAPDHHAAGSPAPARGSMAPAEPARSARNLSGGMPGRASKTDARRSVSQSRAHHHGSHDGHGYAITPARGPSASRLRDRRLRRQRLAAADGGGSSSPPQEGSEPSPDQDRAVPGSSLVEPSNPSADDGSQGGPSDADDEASPGRRNRVKRGLSAELRHGSSPLRQGATTGVLPPPLPPPSAAQATSPAGWQTGSPAHGISVGHAPSGQQRPGAAGALPARGVLLQSAVEAAPSPSHGVARSLSATATVSPQHTPTSAGQQRAANGGGTPASEAPADAAWVGTAPARLTPHPGHQRAPSGFGQTPSPVSAAAADAAPPSPRPDSQARAPPSAYALAAAAGPAALVAARDAPASGDAAVASVPGSPPKGGAAPPAPTAAAPAASAARPPAGRSHRKSGSGANQRGGGPHPYMTLIPPPSPSICTSSAGTDAHSVLDGRREATAAMAATLAPAQAAMHASASARALLARSFAPLGPAKLVESVGHLLVRLSPAVCGEYGQILRCAATMAQSDASCARYFVDLVLRRWPRMDSARAVLLLKFVVAATAAWQPHSGDEVTPASIVAAGPQPARPASAEDAAMEALLRRGHLSSHDSALARRAAAAAAAASLAARRRRPREFLAMGRQAAGMPQAGDLDSAPATPSIRVPEAALLTEPSRPSDEIDEGVFSAARLALMGSRDELRAALVRRVCACLRSPHGQLSTTAAGLCHPFPAASAPPSPFVSVLITSRPCALAIIEALSSPSVAQHWNSTVTKNAKTVSRGIAALALRSGLAARHDIAAAVRRASSAPGAASLGPLQHVGSPTVVTSEPRRGVPAASTSSVTPTSSDHLTRGSTMSVHGPASSPQSRAERAAEPADA